MNNSLIQQILELEFAMFQNVRNRGGRASCQDNQKTFQIMRSSQFSVWSEYLLQSYFQDLKAAKSRCENLIAMKYAWMMKDTYPQEFEEISESLPVISLFSYSTIREIMSIQLPMTEALYQKYPLTCSRGRPLHPTAAYPHTASIQTYLWGELCTYSENTRFLYLRNLQRFAAAKQNIAEQILTHTAHQYGYASLTELESSLAAQSRSSST